MYHTYVLRIHNKSTVYFFNIFTHAQTTISVTVSHFNDKVHLESVTLSYVLGVSAQNAPPGGAASNGPGGLFLALRFLMSVRVSPTMPATRSNPNTTASVMAPIVDAIDLPS